MPARIATATSKAPKTDSFHRKAALTALGAFEMMCCATDDEPCDDSIKEVVKCFLECCCHCCPCERREAC